MVQGTADVLSAERRGGNGLRHDEPRATAQPWLTGLPPSDIHRVRSYRTTVRRRVAANSAYTPASSCFVAVSICSIAFSVASVQRG